MLHDGPHVHHVVLGEALHRLVVELVFAQQDLQIKVENYNKSEEAKMKKYLDAGLLCEGPEEGGLADVESLHQAVHVVLLQGEDEEDDNEEEDDNDDEEDEDEAPPARGSS